MVNFAEYGGGLERQPTISNSVEGSLAHSVALTPSQQQASSRAGTLKGQPSKDRLSRLVNPATQLGPQARLISLAKSKQYAKLASQVPTIFQIQHGQKVLNQSDLVGAGVVLGGQTPQDQYQKTIQQLKLGQKQLKLQRHSKNRSLTSSKVAVGVVAQQHTQSTVHLQRLDQGIEDSMTAAR